MMSWSSLAYADQSAQSTETEALKILYAYMEACNTGHFKAVVALPHKSGQVMRELRLINGIANSATGILLSTVQRRYTADEPNLYKGVTLMLCIIKSNRLT